MLFKKRSKMVHYRVNPERFSQLKGYAQANDLTVSKTLELGFDSLLDNAKKERNEETKKDKTEESNKQLFEAMMSLNRKFDEIAVDVAAVKEQVVKQQAVAVDVAAIKQQLDTLDNKKLRILNDRLVMICKGLTNIFPDKKQELAEISKFIERPNEAPKK